MADPLKTGASALLAFQRSIATTSHNIANSATEGYTRQRVELQANQGIDHMAGHIGQGVSVSGVQRIEDWFAEQQLVQTGSELSRLKTLHDYSKQIDSKFADSSMTLAPAMNQFFESLADANNSPTDSAARMAVLNNAEHFTNKMESLYQELDSVRLQMTGDLNATVDEINWLTQEIASVNQSIVAAHKGVRAPNDLLDQRNQLIQQLSEQVGIDTIDTDNGGLDIYIANGQSLVTGQTHRALRVMDNPSNSSRVPIGFVDAATSDASVGEHLHGGKLGGLVEFNRTVLTPANSELGRIARVFTEAMNIQHAKGVDVNGVAGAELFKTSSIDATGDASNSGSASVNVSLADASKLTLSDYTVGFDGLDYTLTRNSDQAVVTGGSSLSMDGLDVTIGPGMVAGDSYNIAPTRYAARDIAVGVDQGSQLALAFPLRVNHAVANTGQATGSVTNVIDSADPAFSNPVSVTFNDPPSTFDMIDQTSGTVLAANVTYQSDTDISLNGWTIQLSGLAQAGDTFSVEPNSGGIADNRNGLVLAQLQNKALIGNTTKLSDAYGAMIGSVGTRTRQAELGEQSMQGIHNSVVDRRENVSGVNLDEEAINLTRYQQAYQAAAQVINTSEQLFQAIIGAIR